MTALRLARRVLWIAVLTVLAFAATFGLVVAIDLLTRTGDFPGFSLHGRVALTLGILGVAGLTAGLMRLLFYSSRRGFDR